MVILQGQNLSRLFGSEILFHNVNIRIQQQAKIALVGRNGTGKSTLLKILAGLEDSNSGTIAKTKQLKIGYLDQHQAVNTTLTIWQEMLTIFEPVIQLAKRVESIAIQLGDEAILNDAKTYEETLKIYETLQHELEHQNGYTYESDIKSVLFGFKFEESDFHRSISELSGGQKTRLAMAKMLLTPYDLLILDEPTNHLDIETITWLENYLVHYKGALLIVSHDRFFLDKVVTEVYEMAQQSIHYYKGNYTYYVNEKSIRLETQLKQYEQQQQEIEKLETFIQKNITRASTTKRAQSRRKQLEKMVRIEKPITDNKTMHFSFQAEKESGNVVLQAEQLAIGYDNHVLCEPVNLDVRKQDAIGIIGPNGIGKTTLIKTLLNQLPALKGTIKYGSNVSIGYYDQSHDHLPYEKDVLHAIWDNYATVNEKDIRTFLGSFLFSGEAVLKPVSALSGGERARLSLCQLALQKDNVLFLDEPTNHLDLESKEILEQALIDFDGTIIFISHDRYFINRIATTIVDLSETGSQVYVGDYDYYLEKKSDTAITQSETKKEVTSAQAHVIQTKEMQRQHRTLTRELARIEEEMHHTELIVRELEHQLLLPENSNDHIKALDLSQQMTTYRESYDALLEKWETISLELEALAE